MHKKVFAIVCLSLSLLCPALTQASITLPVGPQNDVPLATVTGAWGWTLVYRGGYDVDSVSVASILSQLGTHVMLGGIQDGSTTIDVLAATTVTDFTTHTAHNATTTSNGAEWYYNGGSLGFAGLGDTISQSEADVNDQLARDRLSWHTDGPNGDFGDYAASPTDIRNGWRSGSNVYLNDASNWDKLIFTANIIPGGVVPEPLSLAVWSGLAIAAIAVGMRRSR